MTGGLRIAGLSHRYGATVALDDVSLDLQPGGAVALLGPDGVGKSTLLALAAGAKRLQGGSIHALGADFAVRASRESVQPRIAYMPQGLGRNLYPNLTVAENIGFFARLFGHDRAELDRRLPVLLEATGLAPFAARPMHKLSGGMKQKLGLCCALVHDPDLLILDEPTTGVDPLSRRQFWDLIDAIRRNRPQLALLVATSTMDEAERFAEVVMLDRGRILARGSPAELRARSGCDSLEQAFIHLLPPERRGGLDGPVPVPPLPDGTAEVVIEARGLTRRFGDFTAVDGVDLAIRRGEIFGFLGSNGCGKTTTMKMLTGLLPASAGEGFLFGSAVAAGDFALRRRIGYMAQSFSLYGELTLRQNLTLHAALYGLDAAKAAERSRQLAAYFDLAGHLDTVTGMLPMGLRQRLSLAVAIIHEPEILILDEPTSGVDPVAREGFWRELVRLSREQRVTIFISTHYMAEARRCDRVAFMHAGRIIATGAPAQLQAAQAAATLEEAFIAYMELGGRKAEPILPTVPPDLPGETAPAAPGWFSGRRLRAYAWRESAELLRDPIRLGFALFGTVLLMLLFGYGITFDVDNIRFTVLDRDGTPESRVYIEAYSGTSYFQRREDAPDDAALLRRLRGNDIALAIEIPPGFGADLRRGRAPEVSAWIDGGMPFRAETIAGYVAGAHAGFLADVARQQGLDPASTSAALAVRYRYNQAFRSIDAMVPALFAMMLMLIPAILATLGVVSERERGSITNLYVTPVRKLEFLLGKQMPYAALAYVNVLLLVLMAVFVFGVPLKGSLFGLLLGGLFYVLASTGIELLTSCFTRSQVAALFGTAVLTIMPTVHFSGLMQPVSTLQGGARLIGSFFPATYFLRTSVGAFTKGLGFADLLPFIAATAAFWPALLALAWLFLRKQET